MSSNQPKKIYRYRGLSARTLESLCHDELYFAAPAAFNDPLDCKPTVESDSDRCTLRLILGELVKRRVVAGTRAALKNARLQGQKAEAHATRLGGQAVRNKLADIEYNATNPDYEVSEEEAECRLLTCEIQQELIKQYHRGVCCFSASVYNPLLWSHYGDEHRGICIGYSLDRAPKPKLNKVIYGGSRIIKTSMIAQAVLENDVEAQNLLDEAVLLRKAPSWRYEREWRLLGNKGGHKSTLALQDVTFGLRCQAAVVHAVISALEARDDPIKFFEMYEVHGSFKLKRKSVNTDEMRAFLPMTARSAHEDFSDPVTD